MSLIDLIDGVDGSRPALIPESDVDTAVNQMGASFTSYAQLCSRSIKLARTLGASAARGSVVGIAIAPDSADRVISIVAAMRAGMPWVALEMPVYPQHIVQHIVKDSGMSLIMTAPDEYGQKLKAVAPDLGVPILHVHDGAEPLSLSRAEQSERTAQHERPVATIVYTSGSTGLPKGRKDIGIALPFRKPTIYIYIYLGSRLATLPVSRVLCRQHYVDENRPPTRFVPSNSVSVSYISILIVTALAPSRGGLIPSRARHQCIRLCLASWPYVHTCTTTWPYAHVHG